MVRVFRRHRGYSLRRSRTTKSHTSRLQQPLTKTYQPQIYFWDEILYLFIVPATKISIICFYLRIFPRREIKLWSYALIIANVLYLIAFETVTIFQCTPIDGAWRHWDGEYNATCRNISMQAFGAAIACIVLDVATILLPLPELWRLNLSMQKKLQVMFMFSTGLLYVPRPPPPFFFFRYGKPLTPEEA